MEAAPTSETWNDPADRHAVQRAVVDAATLANLAQLGYVDMTPIQAASLPVALAGRT